jgi:hypothetical protein
MIVYSVTVLDVVGDPILGVRSTPAVYTSLEKAVHVVRNNEGDLADNNLYQYAVIEETYLNKVRPDVNSSTKKYWFKYNTALDEFEECSNSQVPPNIFKLSGFGIG